MGKRLNRNELVGISLLATIVLLITGIAIFAGSGSGGSLQEDPAPVNVEILDTLGSPAPTREAPAHTKKASSRKSGKKASKKSGRKSNKSSKGRKADTVRPDPFSDTIPTY